MARPVIRHASFQNGRWTIGKEVNPWPRLLANVATVIVAMCVAFAGAWEVVQILAGMPHP